MTGGAQPSIHLPDLQGKVALITGASMGIGAATARLLVANGARVALCSRRLEPLDALARELSTPPGGLFTYAGDATQIDQMRAAVTEAERALGPIDILMPFAGGFTAYTPIYAISPSEWREVVETNLTSTFLAVHAALPGMLERQSGSIVTMASNSARVVDVPLTASYAAAKAGVVQFTRHLAKEVGPLGIRANCIAPGTTMTERLEQILAEDMKQRIEQLTPLARLGQPIDAAAAAVFLASDAASFLTGITLDISGGRVML